MLKPLFSLLLLFILVSCNNLSERKTEESTSQGKDSLEALQITLISALHDSLQPKTYALKTRPKPMVINVPKSSGNSYVNTNAKGELFRINLKPPESILVPFLRDEKGEPILNDQGKPFILGKGGQSNFTNYSSDSGLALDLLYCSLTDRRGNIWFGTSGGGVSRYDGYSFTNFTTAQGLGANMIASIFEDSQGNIWVGTIGGGVTKYDGESFINYTIEQGLVHNSVKSIAEDNFGNLYFGTEEGLSRFDGSTFTTLVIADGLETISVRALTMDSHGNIWIGTYGAGISKYDGNAFVSYTIDEGLTNNYVWDILEDRNGKLWFATNNGASSFDPKSTSMGYAEFTNFTPEQGLASHRIISLKEDKSGNLWFGTNGGGVSKYDGKSFVSYTTTQGLPNNVIRSITEDKRGNLWFSTYGGGASKYEGDAFTSYTVSQGLANNLIWTIMEDKNENLWFGTHGGGVSKFNGESFTNFSEEQGLGSAIVHSIMEDKSGKIWFGTNEGVSCYDGHSFTNYSTAQGLCNKFVYCILEDERGNLWIGTEGGVSRFDGESFTNFTSNQGLAGNWIYSIIEDSTGNLWFGTYSDGISRYDGRSFVNFSTEHGLANNSLNGIAEDKSGNLWFGTEEGLSMLSMEAINALNREIDGSYNLANTAIEFSSNAFINFTKKDGLPDNFAAQIAQLPNGKIAVGTNLGLTFFNLSEDLRHLEDIEMYNSNTFYPIKDVNSGHNCMFLDHKGIIWAGTGSEETALVRFDYSALNRNKIPPTLVIRSIKVNEEPVSWYNLLEKKEAIDSLKLSAKVVEEVTTFGLEFSDAERNSMRMHFGGIKFDSITNTYPVPENLMLPYKFNNITIDFSAVETGRPQLVKYQYILEGYQENWSPVQSKTSATFGNINEGSYTFLVKAQSPNGIWSEAAAFQFKVFPPWYRSLPAYLIYALLFLFALRIFSKYRERQLRQEKEKLEKTVEERTEELVQKNIIVENERRRSDELLLNILPEEVAKELKAKGRTDAKQFDEVTVLFTDFKGFTELSEKMTPKELVEEIHTCFMAFDTIIEKHGVEKIKTIGDSYMCAGGLPVPNKTHAIDTVKAGIEIQEFIQARIKARIAAGKEPFHVRIGIHSGPVVAGIVGIKKFQYDIWGDTVNTASRMESNCEVGKVNISHTTYEMVKTKFHCIHRGKIQAKGKGEIDMYFVERAKV